MPSQDLERFSSESPVHVERSQEFKVRVHEFNIRRHRRFVVIIAHTDHKLREFDKVSPAIILAGQHTDVFFPNSPFIASSVRQVLFHRDMAVEARNALPAVAQSGG
jgi:hypothetical protein